MDIEDIVKENQLYKIAYDNKNNHSIIDKFVIDNIELKYWKHLEKKMKEFQKIHKFPFRKVDLVASYHKQNLDKPEFYKIILKKAMRSQSGVLVVTVFTHAHPEFTDVKTGEKKIQKFSCKHNCYFCPLEPARPENNYVEQPRSYVCGEPGLDRARSVNFDTVKQVNCRLAQYMRMGHKIDKLEVLVLGGTFSEYPEEYQKEFIRDIYYASNNAIHNSRKIRFPLETEILLNESSQVRVIGLTLETRPDSINIDEIKKFRSFGCTRVQMGMQHTDDEILKKSNRGHSINDTKKAIKLLKDNCYKLDLHIMPNLLGSSPEIDINMFDKVLYDPDLQADQLKIYPVSVVPWSVYEKLYKNGTYKPYSDEKLRDVLLYAKRRMHPWIRLNRVIRDIPIQHIFGGCSIPHMRQQLDKISKCKCIRCREVKGNNIHTFYRKIRKYQSSGGTEIFISYESYDEKIIYGFLRLRIPSHINKKINKDILPDIINSAQIRELHVYSTISKVGEKSDKYGTQHKGIGSKLLRDAELFSLINGYSSIVCISGIGVREYYRKRGYDVTTTYGYVKKNILPYYINIIYLNFVQFVLSFVILLQKIVKN